MKNARGFLATVSGLVGTTSLWLLSVTAACAHDSSEITTEAYLRTNCLEVRMTIAAATAARLLNADGRRVDALATAADLERVRPRLAASAVELIQVAAANQPLSATQTNVAFSVEDHIELKLIYPRPSPGPLQFNADGLKKLPSDEPYGAVLTVVDIANKSFLGQKLLTAGDPLFEVKVSPLPLPKPSGGPPPAAVRPKTNRS